MQRYPLTSNQRSGKRRQNQRRASRGLKRDTRRLLTTVEKRREGGKIKKNKSFLFWDDRDRLHADLQRRPQTLVCLQRRRVRDTERSDSQMRLRKTQREKNMAEKEKTAACESCQQCQKVHVVLRLAFSLRVS